MNAARLLCCLLAAASADVAAGQTFPQAPPPQHIDEAPVPYALPAQQAYEAPAPPVYMAPAPPRYAAATHWMFQPSYYSHELTAEQWADPRLPTLRSAYRVPTVGANPGFAVQSRYRTNVFTLRNGRNSFDTTVRRSGGVELYP